MHNQKQKQIRQNLSDYARWWNKSFPVDVWYRDHFGIRFNSLEHRKMNFLDMRFELEEMLIALEEKDRREKQQANFDIYKETGKWLKGKIYKEEDVIDAFDSIDLKQLQNAERGRNSIHGEGSSK